MSRATKNPQNLKYPLKQKQTGNEKFTQTLFKIANAVNTTDNLDELYKSIHKSLNHIVYAANFYIALYDRSNDTISFPYSVDLLDDAFQEIKHAKKSSSLTSEVIQKGKPLFFTKQEMIARAKAMNLEVDGPPADLWLGVPLKAKNSVMGAIVIQSYDNANIYDQKDMDTLIAVSDQVALAINRKLAEDAQKKSEEINKVLFAISNAANTTLNLDDLYESIHVSLSKIMDLSNFYIALYNKKKDCITFPYFIDEKDPIDSVFTIEDVMNPLNPSSTSWVIQSGKPQLFSRHDLICRMKKINKELVGTPPAVWMGSPLKIKGQVIGAMVAQSYTSPTLYNNQDLEIFNSVSDQVALAIERQRAQDAETESKAINKVLFSISNAVNTTENLDELYKSIHNALESIIDVSNFMIGIYDTKKDSISYSYYKDRYNNNPGDYQNVSRSGILAAEVINLGKPFLITKDQILKRAKKIGAASAGPAPEQWLGIPLKIKNEVSGVLVVQSYSKPELYTEKDVEILVSISDQIAFAIERKRAQEELVIAKNAAEASAESKSEFLANMSHEIRTPMNAIMGLTELTLKTRLDSRQKDFLNKIKSSTTSLLGIINDILDFSKIDAGKMNIEKINFKLEDVMDSISDMFSNKTAEKNIELIVSIANDIPLNLIGDPLRLRQALINLTGNAVKFTEKGEIVVSVTISKIKSSHVELKFTIKDTGIGISENRLHTLFESFVQADGSTTRKYGGTGLGLSISKKLIELMGGSISVKSREGKGTEFTFFIPFEKKDIKTTKKKYIDTDLHGLKVLVIDDNKTARDIMRTTLSSFRFHVETIDSGEKAIVELIKAAKSKKPYKLIILDLVMPGIDGIETAEQIKNNYNLLNIPIIMMTGFGREDTMQQAKKANVNAFLMKPVKQSILLDTIMDIFGKKPDIDISESTERNDTITESIQLDGLNVLLVEDNKINQLVASEILKEAGIKVTIASTGVMALKFLDNNKFDIVLMDIQMPEMDGYTATGEIRNRLKLTDLPIIAMTAHAMAGDKEKCINAGMDDYIPKPIDPAMLYSKLLQYKPQDNIKASVAQEKQNEIIQGKKELSMKLPDSLPGIDIKSGLERFMENSKLFIELFTDFIKNHKDSADKILSLVNSNNIKKALEYIHSIKGTAGNLSAIKLYEASSKLEDFIEENSKIDKVLLKKYSKAIIEVSESLNKINKDFIIQKTDNNNKTVFNNTDIGNKINLLHEKILQNDLDAIDVFSRVKDMLQEKISENKIHKLDEAINNFDFDKAKIILEKIAGTLNITLEGIKNG